MSILNNSLLLGADAGGAAGYQISRSLRFNSSDSAYLSAGLSTFTSRTVGTISFWFKAAKLGVDRVLAAGWDGGVNYSGSIQLTSGNILFVGVGGDLEYGFRTTAVFRDPSAWYHVVAAWNRGAAAADKVKVWVNGVAQTSTDTGYQSWTSGNCQIFCPNTGNRIGRGDNDRYGNYLDGYLAEYFFIDGQALTPSSFGEFSATTGVWVPKAYTGSYGTNGFHLDFADNSAATATTLGKDAAGSNNWTPNNLSVTAGAGNDSLIDVPVNGSEVDTGLGGQVRGNYATLTPLTTANAITNGGLSTVTDSVTGSGTASAWAVNAPGSLKWYWEVRPTSGITGASNACELGITAGGGSDNFLRTPTFKYTSSESPSYTNSDTIGFAYDGSTSTLYCYKNGTLAKTVTSASSSEPLFPYIRDNLANASISADFNFGQRPFANTAPSGFKALCTANLPAPTIVKPSTAMDVKLYTGNTTGQTITGLGFNPDLVWFKARGATYSHQLYDSVRGGTASLSSNNTSAEVARAGAITSFNSNGFTIGDEGGINDTSIAMAAWCWDAGSSTVTNTAGSITSQVRANASAGFSVVTYTGTGANATVGHGLGVAPQFIITKCRGAASDWGVYHASVGATAYLRLNLTNASSTGVGPWNNTAPTSTVFSIGTNAATNTANTMVAYCFAPVVGYSSFGSYTGNGSTDGPFVYTGFRPRWVMIKITNTGGTTDHWVMWDTARDDYNVADSYLLANNPQQEVTSSAVTIDALSNGFKLRNSSSNQNGSGSTYIYAAFAEAPFQYARAR